VTDTAYSEVGMSLRLWDIPGRFSSIVRESSTCFTFCSANSCPVASPSTLHYQDPWSDRWSPWLSCAAVYAINLGPRCQKPCLLHARAFIVSCTGRRPNLVAMSSRPAMTAGCSRFRVIFWHGTIPAMAYIPFTERLLCNALPGRFTPSAR
jgi:hypothetical protein